MARAVGIRAAAGMIDIFFSLSTNPKRKEAKEKDLVRMRGLEPPRVSPLPPQGSVSTSSTTSAPKTVAIAQAIDPNITRILLWLKIRFESAAR